MTEQSLPEEALVTFQKYVAWRDDYGPFEWIEFDSVGGLNYLRAQSTDVRLVWTDYHDSENLIVASGFHYWEKFEVHGWHVATKARKNPDNPTEFIQCSFYGQCGCYDDESGAGLPDCEEFGCGGSGFRDYYFE